MSLKDLFNKEGRKEKSIQKNCLKAANSKIKPDDRRPALFSLLEECGGMVEIKQALSQNSLTEEERQAKQAQLHYAEEAVQGLLKRFTFNYDTNIVMDEEEKDYIYQELVKLGPSILDQIRKHLRTSPTLSWGLRMIHDVCDHETVWQVLTEILPDYEPGYERDPSRKLQLMTFLGEFLDSRAIEVLLPYLGDHDETVRYVTIESLIKQADERAREPLLAVLNNDEEESLRIKARIADGFADTGWLVKGYRGSVEKLFATQLYDFILDGKGKVRRRKAREA